MRDEVTEETLFFALSYVVGCAYCAAKGARLDHKIADGIAFAILDDFKQRQWRLFEVLGSERKETPRTQHGRAKGSSHFTYQAAHELSQNVESGGPYRKVPLGRPGRKRRRGRAAPRMLLR